MREGRQLYTANLLMFFSILLVLCQWRTRTWAGLEHPEEPAAKPQAPSIWATYIMQLLKKLPGLSLASLYQGYFGAVSPKPTSFLLAWDDNAVADLEKQYRSKRVLPAPLPMGLRDDKKFYNTAQLKEYPEPLCQLLAAAFYRHVQRTHHAEDQSFQDHSDEMIASLTPLVAPIIAGVSFGPDYAFN
eukprot:Skav211709  [mRNA]  locus=scaffold2852:123808:124368:- [translate_table: standard]